MTNSQAVLFDLDGTLLDTLNDLATSGNEVLANRGLPTHPIDAYRSFIGDGMGSLVQRIFPEPIRPTTDSEIQIVLDEYRAAYDRHWQDTTSLFPGINELLNELVAADVPIGVLSNKSHDFTIKCVEAFLPDWSWTVVLGARDNMPKKPDPIGAIEAAQRMGTDPKHCFFIGDSDVDMQTAVNAAMHPIGVAWGFRSVDELNQCGAEIVIDQPCELINFMQQAV